MIGREHQWAQALHAASFVACILVLVCEVIRFVQELRYERDQVPTNTVACRWYEPASDIPTHQIGRVTAAVFHMANVVAIAFLAICDLPGKPVTAWVARFWRGTGKGAGLWYQGALQVLIGSSLAATPANVYGDVRLQIFRLASAYILLGMGIVNIIIGMVWQGEIRAYRHQITTLQEAVKRPDEPPDEAREAWTRLMNIMSGVHYLRPEDKKKMNKRLEKMKALLAKL